MDAERTSAINAAKRELVRAVDAEQRARQRKEQRIMDLYALGVPHRTIAGWAQLSHTSVQNIVRRNGLGGDADG